MKSRYSIAAVFLATLIFSTCTFTSATQAQSVPPLFEGTIAYIDLNGNVVIVNGKGGFRQITSDASLEEWISYSRPKFSPDGRYLAFVSNNRTKLIIYDVHADSITGEFIHDSSGDFLQWHRDSDSFIFAPSHLNDPNPANVDCLRDYYRQFLTGEQSLIYSLWKSDNGFNINFDLNTIVYATGISCGSNEMGIVIENWETKTKHVLPTFVDMVSTVGIWTADGRYYIKDELAEDGKLYIVDLKSGEIVRTINVKDLIFQESGGIQSTYTEYIDISSDSRHLLIADSGNLYDVDIETSTIRHLYKNQYLDRVEDPYDAYLNGSWSASGNLVMVYENDPQNRLFNNDTDLTVIEDGQAAPVSKNVIPFFWIENSEDRFLYAKNDLVGQTIYPTLMIYDHGRQTSAQIGNLPPLESAYPVETSLVDWTAAEFDLPQGSTTTEVTPPVPSNIATPSNNGQQNPTIARPFGNLSYLLYCLLCLLFLLILAALMIFYFSRRRKRKDVREEKQEQMESFPPVATSAEQVKRAIGLSKSKRHKEAFEILRGIVQTEPNNMSAWFNLGGVLASMGNYKDAERCYLRAKQLGHPRGEEALNWLQQHRK